MTTTFAAAHQGLVEGFNNAWLVIRPSWDLELQTAMPPRAYDRQANVWLKVMYTDQAMNDVAVNTLRRVDGLLTVDTYSRFDADDFSTFAGVQTLNDDVLTALEAMALPAAVDEININKQDLALTPTKYEHSRFAVFVRYNRAA